jgi:hypothetical protein
MKHLLKKSLKSFLVELVVYSGLVLVYYALVLHFLGNSLLQLYLHDRRVYSALALALIVGQGLLLEGVTRLLLAWITPARED